MSDQKNDIEIIQKIISGDQKSFDIIYEKYSRLYFLTCIRYFKNRQEAEDLVQEAFISIFKSLKQYDHTKSNFSTWSNRVVVNVCLQQLRRKNIFRDVDDIIDIAQNVVVEPTAVDHLNLKDLTKLILNLPKGYRTVFNMYVIDGFTHKEIGDQLGISTSTSKTQLMKARKMLQLNLKSTEQLPNGSYAYGR